jgi:uncharacterized protein YegP (UPF0339 family)
MATTEREGGRLYRLYARYVGEPESKKDVYGYWLFLFGSLVSFLGIGVYLLGTSTGLLEGVANSTFNTFVLVTYSTAAVGLPVALFGIVLLLPVQRWGIALTFVGTAIALVGVGWFTQVFPENWPPVDPGATNLAPQVVAVYASGVAAIILVTMLVPIFTGERSLFFESEYQRSEEYSDVAVGESLHGGQFTVFRRDDAWEWRLLDQEAVAGSPDDYLSRLETEESVQNIKDKVAEAGLLEIKNAAFRLYEAAEDRWNWVLMSESGGVLADSQEDYEDRSEAADAVNDIKELGPDAELIDIDGSGAFEFLSEGSAVRWQLVDDQRTPLAEGPRTYDGRPAAEDGMELAREGADGAKTVTIDTIGVELYQREGAGGEWHWRLLDNEDAELARSERGYDGRRTAEESVYDLLEDVAGAPVMNSDEPAYEVVPHDPSDGWQFRLVDDDERVVGRSHGTLDSAEAAEGRAQMMRDHAGSADVVTIEDAEFEYYRAGDGWRWRLVDEDREVLAESVESFDSEDAAADSVEETREHAESAELIEFEEAAFQVYAIEDGGEGDAEWRWRLIDEDGNVEADSGETHDSKDSAVGSMMTIKERAPNAEVLEIDTAAFELFEDENGEWNWRLVDITGETVAQGPEMLPSRQEARDAMQRLEDATADPDARAMDSAIFQVYADESDAWRWRFVHPDGTVVADGTGEFGTRDEAVGAIEPDLRDTAAGADVFTIPSLAVQVDARGERFSWRVVDSDRDTVATSSRSHADRSAVVSEVDLFTEHAEEASVFELAEPSFLVEGGEDGWTWRLVGADREPIMFSTESYESREAAEDAIDDAQAVVADADVLDYEGAAFELVQFEDEGVDRWRWQMVDEGGERMATGASDFATREEAGDAVEEVRRELDDASILKIESAAFELQEDEGYWSWRLIDENGNPIAHSLREYESRREAREAMETLQEHAPTAQTSVAE